MPALSLDYWDTLFDGGTLPERLERRQEALRRMLRNLGCDLPDHEFSVLYRASAAEADRWWREEHRGYTADERIRWMLGQLNVTRDRKSTRLNSSHSQISYAVFCLKKKKAQCIQ